MSAQGPFSSAHPFSSGFLKAWVDQTGAFQDMFARLADQSTAAIPALGLSREYQESAARLLDLSKQFQQRYAEFAQQNAAIMQDAFQVMKKRLDAAPPAPSSPAELYDAWIDCAEGTYAQAAHSERFARLLAELCNISSAFKVERGKLTEQIARHLDLPSRAEVDTLHHQVRALKLAMCAATSHAAAPHAAAPQVTASRPAVSRPASARAKSSKPPAKPRKRGKK
jgi:class III poly(R)-hydroxyalkanoic acid synthase PhaE subunit